MKSLSRITLCCLLALIGESFDREQLAAQDRAVAEVEEAALDPVQKAEQDAAEFKKRVENRVIEEFRMTAQSRLLLEIEELDRVCDLDAKSVKKLEIAAKGAAERWIRNQEERLRGRVRFNQFGPDIEIRVAGRKVPRPGEPEEEPETEQVKSEKKVPAKPVEKPPVLQAINRLFGAAPAPRPAVRRVREEDKFANITVAVQRYGLQYRVKHRGGSSSSGFGGGLEELKREAVWTRTIQDVVTPEQKLKVEAATEARRRRLREAAIVYAIGQLDLELRLTEEQHSQLRELFDARVKVENVAPNSVRYTVERQIKETDHDVLKPILSEAQLKVWDEYASW